MSLGLLNWRPSKLQEKPSALKREHSHFQKWNFLNFFFFCGSSLLSWIRIQSGSNPDPDPQHCQKARILHKSLLNLRLRVPFASSHRQVNNMRSDPGGRWAGLDYSALFASLIEAIHRYSLLIEFRLYLFNLNVKIWASFKSSPVD